MKTETVMIARESSVIEMISELKDVISKENILIKIISDLEFDLMFGSTVDVEIDLDKEVLEELNRVAHEKDITLNLLINRILSNKINEVESKGIHISAKADTSFEVKINNEDGKEVLNETVKPIKMEDLKKEVNNTIIERSDKELEILIDTIVK